MISSFLHEKRNVATDYYIKAVSAVRWLSGVREDNSPSCRVGEEDAMTTSTMQGMPEGPPPQ